MNKKSCDVVDRYPIHADCVTRFNFVTPLEKPLVGATKAQFPCLTTPKTIERPHPLQVRLEQLNGPWLTYRIKQGRDSQPPGSKVFVQQALGWLAHSWASVPNEKAPTSRSVWICRGSNSRYAAKYLHKRNVRNKYKTCKTQKSNDYKFEIPSGAWSATWSVTWSATWSVTWLVTWSVTWSTTWPATSADVSKNSIYFGIWRKEVQDGNPWRASTLGWQNHNLPVSITQFIINSKSISVPNTNTLLNISSN